MPGTQDQFLINPYGLIFDEITASSLVKIDLDGKKVEESPFPVNPRASSSTAPSTPRGTTPSCVLHTHSLNGVAVSTQRAGLLPISQHSIFVLASLGYHDFEGVGAQRRGEAAPRGATSATIRT